MFFQNGFPFNGQMLYFRMKRVRGKRGAHKWLFPVKWFHMRVDDILWGRNMYGRIVFVFVAVTFTGLIYIDLII